MFYVRALYDYQPGLPEEFGFREGDIIAVTHTDEDGWWDGEHTDPQRRAQEQANGSETFPSNFVVMTKD